MRRTRTFLFSSLPALLAFATAPLLGQVIPPQLPAVASPPPEIQELEKQRPPEQPRPTPPTREELLSQLEQLKPGSTRPENLKRGNPLAATPTPPREMQELEERKAPEAAAPTRPVTREELLESIRQLPQGPQILEEAKQRGARISTLSTAVWDLLAWLNPFHVQKAWAQSTYSVTVTPASPYSSSPYAVLGFYGGIKWGTGTPGLRSWSWSSPMSFTVTNPIAGFGINVPTPGFYIVNFNGHSYNTKAMLNRWTGSGYQTVTTWDYSGRNERLNYPVVLELAAGYHYFYLGVTQGTLFLYQANSYSL